MSNQRVRVIFAVGCLEVLPSFKSSAGFKIYIENEHSDLIHHWLPIADFHAIKKHAYELRDRLPIKYAVPTVTIHEGLFSVIQKTRQIEIQHKSTYWDINESNLAELIVLLDFMDTMPLAFPSSALVDPDTGDDIPF